VWTRFVAPPARPWPDVTLEPGSWYYLPAMAHAAVEPASDAGLASRAARGDVEAYERLVRQYHGSCLRYASRMLRDDADAEDAVQDTFMRAHLALSRYDDRQPFRAWIFRILVNRCRTLALQRARRTRRFADDPLALENTAAPVHDTGNHAEVIRRAVDELEPLLREAFLLKYVEGMEYQEMSAVLGAGVSALKMRVKRACDALRPRLQEIYDD
jgi:RNA polymerase sigma-70 factor (ECF subfamily)